MREEEMAVAIAAIIAVTIFGALVVRHVSWVIKAWIETALKRDMVARGYSAEEIVAVITSDRRCRPDHSLHDIPPAKPLRQPAYSS